MTIISFEGLGGSFGRWIRRGLLVHFPDIPQRELLWTSKPVAHEGPCIIVAHSFGVKAAIESARLSKGCKYLLLLDPRMPPLGIGGGAAPLGVKTACLYRRGFMRGYPTGNAANIELDKSYGHLDVPFSSYARAAVKNVL